MTNKNIIEESLKKSKEEEKKHIPTLKDLENQDKEFKKEAKELKKMLKSFGKKI